MKVTALGAGSAFSLEQYQSNFLIEFDNGKKMLFDAGGDVRHALKKVGLTFNDIDYVWVSHLHSDHCGGLEGLALVRFFNKNLAKPVLYTSEHIIDNLWDDTLKGGLSTYQGVVLRCKDYFDLQPIPSNSYFTIDNCTIFPVQTVHIMNGFVIVPSFGLMIDYEDEKYEGGLFRLYITSDTQFSPYQINDFYKSANLILEDCETSPYKSHVHAHYEDLKTLDEDVKGKMWLYHYQDQPYKAKSFDEMQKNAIADGFKGFLVQGQEIVL